MDWRFDAARPLRPAVLDRSRGPLRVVQSRPDPGGAPSRPATTKGKAAKQGRAPGPGLAAGLLRRRQGSVVPPTKDPGVASKGAAAVPPSAAAFSTSVVIRRPGIPGLDGFSPPTCVKNPRLGRRHRQTREDCEVSPPRSLLVPPVRTSGARPTRQQPASPRRSLAGQSPEGRLQPSLPRLQTSDCRLQGSP